MYKEVNTGTNLPAQIDLCATDGDEYKFLCIAKGGGSANKTYLYQETKALITPAKLKNYLVEKMRTLGTAASSTVPYRLRDRRYLGGSDAEDRRSWRPPNTTMALPTEGVTRHGQAFRDVQLEQRSCCWWRRTLVSARSSAANTFAHDIRVIRLPRHGASSPGRDGGFLFRRPQHQSQD